MSPPLPISTCIIEDWFHGLYTAVLILTLWVIATGKQPAINASRRSLQVALVVVPYICSTVHAAVNWLWYANAVDDNELPSGPGLLYSLTHIPAWLEATGDTFFCLNILLADCVFIWRCSRIWNRRWQIVILPILATITGAVLAGIIIADQVVARRTSEPFIAAKKSSEFINLSSIYFSLSMATSLTTTLLISLRIFLVQRAASFASPQAHKLFNPIIEILVESAALYSATLLAFVVFNTQKSVNVYYAQNIHAQLAGLAPLLIILRIATGRARPQSDWDTTISFSTTMKFTNPSNSPSVATMVDSASYDCEATL
ncbi:hypothetical protein MIND_01356600 [Mycena indigotica]|uniref:Uncharacterized protein n=1 Tax=Mycena indigotica TaxID=2126181 RepID=A0A8H6S014_9AGAR|nr:uncharacterized protein MIND_01356600 [Mycena indigotica]KAF7289823.1 hypothetical protein MIND_01356600 [Mycena indigotica]